MVGLHALQSIGVESPALEVNRTLLGGNSALAHTSGPNGVPHCAPRVCWVGSEDSVACLSGVEARGCPCDLEVDNGSLIVQALDGVESAILGQLESAVVGIEAGLVLAKIMVVQGRRAPEMGGGWIGIEDLAVELAGSSDTASHGNISKAHSQRATSIMEKPYATLL